MRLQALADWITDTLDDPPYVAKGPRLPDIPGRYILLTPYGGGGGFAHEQLTSNRPIQVRSVGEQGDWDGAEYLAQQVDYLFTFGWPDSLDGAAVIRVVRSGGDPYPLMVDDAERAHFVCSYLWEIESTAPVPASSD